MSLYWVIMGDIGGHIDGLLGTRENSSPVPGLAGIFFQHIDVLSVAYALVASGGLEDRLWSGLALFICLLNQ